MAHTLPDLGYAHDALEPHIDARTMEIHHGKHHAAYVAKLNDALEGTDLGSQSIEDLMANIGSVPEGKRQAVITQSADCAVAGGDVDMVGHVGLAQGIVDRGGFSPFALGNQHVGGCQGGVSSSGSKRFGAVQRGC